MSSKGPTMGGGRYGSAWNGRKLRNPAIQGGGRRSVRRPDLGASDGDSS